jgi:hypothetical protein
LVKPLGVGLGLSLDYRAQALADVGLTPADFGKNWRSPQQLQETLAQARKAVQLVWLWSSFVDLWGRSGAALAPLPSDYAAALAPDAGR